MHLDTLLALYFLRHSHLLFTFAFANNQRWRQLVLQSGSSSLLVLLDANTSTCSTLCFLFTLTICPSMHTAPSIRMHAVCNLLQCMFFKKINAENLSHFQLCCTSYWMLLFRFDFTSTNSCPYHYYVSCNLNTL